MRLNAADFAGEWRVEREIADRLAGQPGRFDGVARFAPVPGGLRYEEEGVLRLGEGAGLTARRAYLWHFGAAGVEVAFHDGRPFHRFAVGESGAGTDHLCGADLYRVAYDWSAWPDWRAVWEVTGPRKDYRMESRYRRD